MVEKKNAITKRKETASQGVVYVPSRGNVFFDVPPIHADKIKAFEDNLYGAGLSAKQRHLVFTDKYTLEVFDSEGVSQVDVSNDMRKMCESKSVRLWPNMQRAYVSVLWWGVGLFNPVWKWVDGVYTLTELRHLPSYSFRKCPLSNSFGVCADILEGIVLNDSGEIEYYQIVDRVGTTQKIDDIFYIRDPTAEGIAGKPIILPLIPFFEMLEFAWDTQMQQTNRTGAKVIFIKVTDPQPASAQNDYVGDVEHANNLLREWGKDSGFQLRGNMELIDPGIRDDGNNIEIIEALNNAIIDFISPTSYLSSNSDKRLGGSDKSREEMILKYIKGIHSWIQDQFEMLLNKYLSANGYVGYTVKITIPSPTIDRSAVMLEQARLGAEQGFLFKNELRKLIGMEALDDDDLVLLAKEYENRTQGTISFPVAASSVLDTRNEEPPAPEKKIEKKILTAAEKLAEDITKALEL